MSCVSEQSFKLIVETVFFGRLRMR